MRGPTSFSWAIQLMPWKFLLPSRALAHEPAKYSLFILNWLCFKKVPEKSKNLLFSRIFLNFFKFLLILMHIFEKLPFIFEALPNRKFGSDPRKLDPSKQLADSLNRKILHHLLQTLNKFSIPDWESLTEINSRIFQAWAKNSWYYNQV